jgi:hypothetical protein
MNDRNPAARAGSIKQCRIAGSGAKLATSRHFELKAFPPLERYVSGPRRRQSASFNLCSMRPRWPSNLRGCQFERGYAALHVKKVFAVRQKLALYGFQRLEQQFVGHILSHFVASIERFYSRIRRRLHRGGENEVAKTAPQCCFCRGAWRLRRNVTRGDPIEISVATRHPSWFCMSAICSGLSTSLQLILKTSSPPHSIASAGRLSVRRNPSAVRDN